MAYETSVAARSIASRSVFPGLAEAAADGYCSIAALLCCLIHMNLRKSDALCTTTGMHQLRISLSRIHYFYITQKMGSMRAASDFLNVAPSSISRQIAQLEEEVGLPLIERRRRSIKLTEAGEAVIAYYREELALEETFRENLEDLRGLKRGNIRVAMGEGFVSQSIANVVANFIASHPHIRINVDVAATKDLVRMISEDDVHFGLTFEAPADPNLSRRLSLEAPMRLLVSPDHALASKPQVSLQEVTEHALALPSGSFRIREVLQRAEAEEGVYLASSFMSNSLALLKDFACSGKGITILPQVAAIGELSSGKLVAVPINSRALSETTINVMTRRGRHLPLAMVEFMNTISASLTRWLKQ